MDVSQDLLRRDVRLLGDLLGNVITTQAGTAAFELVEEIRAISRNRRNNRLLDDSQLSQRIGQLTVEESRVVARAFGMFFDVSNIAEDRHRVRVLRDRELARADAGAPLPESIAAGIKELREAGKSPEDVQLALDQLSIELVFTAHPSEAKRRCIRAKLRRMRQSLQEFDRRDLLNRERERLVSRLKTELTILWQTDFLKPQRPTVMQEVERGLSITPRLWEVVPGVYDSLRRALASEYPGVAFRIPVFLQFGTWMGGDRDGNPNVTAEVTEETLRWLRRTAIQQHLNECRRMYDFLSLSVRETHVDPRLSQGLTAAAARWPAVAELLSSISSREIYRRWILLLQWRLQQSLLVTPAGPAVDGAYRRGSDLVADIQVICDSLRASDDGIVVESELQRWVDLARIFGLHLARLDVRQDARRYREVMTEVFKVCGLCDDFAALDEPGRQQVLVSTMPFSQPIAEAGLTPLATDTLRLFQVLARCREKFGGETLGGHITSLTQEPSDVLCVLWLWKWAVACTERESTPTEAARTTTSQTGATSSGFAESARKQPQNPELRIMPLFEKIGDLNSAASTLQTILMQPAYAEYVRSCGNRQLVMVGYSDSTKDGGYLAACWSLYQAQQELHAVAGKLGVQLTFFHGRGGSLGRGGGPAARGILSLPQETLDGSLRLTEQGEVLAERYDDVQIAARHLEQVTWATLLSSCKVSAASSANVSPAIFEQWQTIMAGLAARSQVAYRDLVDRSGFIKYFAQATPIDVIEDLPIASRPARRRGERTLNDLRAIPWVFSWTQNRCMIPAWYGLGTAVAELKRSDAAAFSALSAMYRSWPYWTAAIDNAALALAKVEMTIAQRYAELCDDAEVRWQLWKLIAQEAESSRQMILEITGTPALLDNTPWLRDSINSRNPYVDPLNLIQIEALKRRRQLAAGTEPGTPTIGSDAASGITRPATDTPDVESDMDQRLRDLLRLSVQGIAAGMRTTG